MSQIRTQLLQAFDARNFDPSQGTPPLPVGPKQLFQITGGAVESTKAGDGGLVKLDVEIVDGPNTGAQGSIRFNLYSSSQQAAEIAHRSFSALCHCVGQLNVTDLTQLFGTRFRGDVMYQKGHAPGEPDSKGYTEVRKFYDVNGNEPSKGGGAPVGQPQGQAAGWGNQAAGGQAPAQQPQQAQQQPAANTGWGQQPQGQQTAQQPTGGTWGQQPQGGQPQAGWGQQPATGNGATWGRQ